MSDLRVFKKKEEHLFEFYRELDNFLGLPEKPGIKESALVTPPKKKWGRRYV